MRWFKIAAIAEACSWAGLLIGMFFKHVAVGTEIGVKIFGPIHGVLFIAYIIALAAAYPQARWSKRITAYGLLAAVPPFMTLWFERYAAKKAA